MCAGGVESRTFLPARRGSRTLAEPRDELRNIIATYVAFYFWFASTVGILLGMDVMEPRFGRETGLKLPVSTLLKSKLSQY